MSKERSPKKSEDNNRGLSHVSLDLPKSSYINLGITLPVILVVDRVVLIRTQTDAGSVAQMQRG